MLDYLSEHPVHEQWWEARNEDGEIGFVPSSYVIEKEDQVSNGLNQPLGSLSHIETLK